MAQACLVLQDGSQQLRLGGRPRTLLQHKGGVAEPRHQLSQVRDRKQLVQANQKFPQQLLKFTVKTGTVLLRKLLLEEVQALCRVLQQDPHQLLEAAHRPLDLNVRFMSGGRGGGRTEPIQMWEDRLPIWLILTAEEEL